jgi:hypothetical protein
LISESASLRASTSFSRWASSVNRQKTIIPVQAASTATPWRSDHSHGCWPPRVVEDQGLLPRGADAVADHGEDDVDEERRPVLVERDEADDDEEVEVRLDVPCVSTTSAAEQ